LEHTQYVFFKLGQLFFRDQFTYHKDGINIHEFRRPST